MVKEGMAVIAGLSLPVLLRAKKSICIGSRVAALEEVGDVGLILFFGLGKIS